MEGVRAEINTLSATMIESNASRNVQSDTDLDLQFQPFHGRSSGIDVAHLSQAVAEENFDPLKSYFDTIDERVQIALALALRSHSSACRETETQTTEPYSPTDKTTAPYSVSTRDAAIQTLSSVIPGTNTTTSSGQLFPNQPDPADPAPITPINLLSEFDQVVPPSDTPIKGALSNGLDGGLSRVGSHLSLCFIEPDPTPTCLIAPNNLSSEIDQFVPPSDISTKCAQSTGLEGNLAGVGSHLSLSRRVMDRLRSIPAYIESLPIESSVFNLQNILVQRIEEYSKHLHRTVAPHLIFVMVAFLTFSTISIYFLWDHGLAESDYPVWAELHTSNRPPRYVL